MVNGLPNPLDQSRLRYGTEDDVDHLIKQILHTVADTRQYIYIDFTPFERIGHPDDFLKKLSSINFPRPILLIMSDNLEAQLKNISHKITLPYIKFSDKCKFEKISGGLKKDKYIKKLVLHDFKYNNFKSLADFRQQITENNLINLLYNPDCLIIPRLKQPHVQIEKIAGRYYIKMPNKMLVSCYLNLKEIGGNYNALTDLAYEIVLILMEYFRRDINPLENFDLLLTPNNTALFLASAIQIILEKPVICIDRLGPIPTLSLQRSHLLNELKDKNVVLLEEVMATGNEVDRVILFLSQLQSNIKKIISLYNLEVGMSLLTTPDQMISLSHPKRAIAYEYRSI